MMMIDPGLFMMLIFINSGLSLNFFTFLAVPLLYLALDCSEFCQCSVRSSNSEFPGQIGLSQEKEIDL